MATPSILLRAAALASLTLAAAPPMPLTAWAAVAPPAAANARPAHIGATAATTAAAAASGAPSQTHAVKRRRSGVTRTMRVIRTANSAALSTPSANAFLNAALIYDYEIGRLYRIDASPRFLTTILLRPGEHLISKAAGDTIRWSIGETSQGAGETAQAEVVLKPVRGGQRTNLVLTTDQRTYFLEAVSHDEPIYTSVISWNYPLDQLREAQAQAARAKAAAASAAAQSATVVDASLTIDRLNFGYRIDHPKAKHGPPWEPTTVFDDGTKTYLQFPPTMASSAAPPLFLIGSGGQAELVNYRVKGAYYIVDRLIDVAELRLGEKPQTIVRVTRTGAHG